MKTTEPARVEEDRISRRALILEFFRSAVSNSAASFRQVVLEALLLFRAVLAL